jgi:hypothetical protein
VQKVCHLTSVLGIVFFQLHREAPMRVSKIEIFQEYFFFLVFSSDDFMLIGEVFVDGQNRDVWCNSKKPITDWRMYVDNSIVQLTDPVYLKITTCYIAHKNSDIHMDLKFNNTCLSSYLLDASNYYILCE